MAVAMDVELQLAEVHASTAGFADQNIIGRGGFGKVFFGDPIPRLQRPEQLVAVKLADLGKLELSDLQKEVAILRKCNHPHLLPLIGLCVDPTAACLVFPLMVGGCLQTRLDLQPSDLKYLRRMGHFATTTPKPLTWRQKLRVVGQAVDALVYLTLRQRARAARGIATSSRQTSCSVRTSPRISATQASRRPRRTTAGSV